MARVSYQLIPPELRRLVRSAISPGDRFTHSTIRRTPLFTSRLKKIGLSQRSLIPTLSPVWNAFDSTTKTAWNNAGAVSGISGWKLFLADTTHRIVAGGTGYATPSLLHQSLVGQIVVNSPANHVKLQQLHPSSYVVKKKIKGTRSQYDIVPMVETFTLPLTISISAKTDFVSTGANTKVRFFCIVYSWYQGVTVETPVSCDLPLDADWANYSQTINLVIGDVRGYTAHIEVYNANGTLQFDNVSIYHGGLNWARDPRCNRISQSFTGAFFQVPKHWAVEVLESGADYGTIYPL